MKESYITKLTGVFGLGTFVLAIITIPMYFIYEGPPPLTNILTRGLINLLVCVGIIAFFTGFQNVIIKQNQNNNFLGTFIGHVGLAYAIVVLVAESIQIGSVWAHANPVDPTVVGNGGEGALLIYGPIERILSAMLLIASGAAIIRTAIIPKWVGWFGYVVSLCQLAFVPTLFYMSEPYNFYSTNGWNIPIAGGIFLIWILITSIYFVLKKE